MANQEHLRILSQGVDVWNRWLKDHKGERPDLSGANLRGALLGGVDLRGSRKSPISYKSL
ncbi:MAG: pentapeptide repeat-containing protein [Chlorobiaceae bacterium]